MPEKIELLEMTADVVAAHVANNSVAVGDLQNLISQVHQTLAGLARNGNGTAQVKTPVVPVRASISQEYLICMECGRKQKTLRRHLQSAHGMTAEQYRKDYGLPYTYPMTAPEYSERRREVARSTGLGRDGRRLGLNGPSHAADPAEEQITTDDRQDTA